MVDLAINSLPKGVKFEVVEELGAEVLHLAFKGIRIVIGAGTTTAPDGSAEPWVTVYRIEAVERITNNKPLRELLTSLKKHYKKLKWDFAVSRAATPWQKYILDSANIPVREECTGVLVDRLKVAAI